MDDGTESEDLAEERSSTDKGECAEEDEEEEPSDAADINLCESGLFRCEGG
jgi:hypothetical protein